jgi:hypothetical protein
MPTRDVRDPLAALDLAHKLLPEFSTASHDGSLACSCGER